MKRWGIRHAIALLLVVFAGSGVRGSEALFHAGEFAGSDRGYVGCLESFDREVFVCVIAFARADDAYVRILGRFVRSEYFPATTIYETYAEEVSVPLDALQVRVEHGIPTLYVDVVAPRTGHITLRSQAGSGDFGSATLGSGCEQYSVYYYLLETSQMGFDPQDDGEINGVRVIESRRGCNMYFTSEAHGRWLMKQYIHEGTFPEVIPT